MIREWAHARSAMHPLSRPVAVAIGAALLASGLCAWQLTLQGVLTGAVTQYDDGVYLGAAIRFVSGVLPYRDFVFVQPPGIVVLMSPVALLGRAMGLRGALVLRACRDGSSDRTECRSRGVARSGSRSGRDGDRRSGARGIPFGRHRRPHIDARALPGVLRPARVRPHVRQRRAVHPPPPARRGLFRRRWRREALAVFPFLALLVCFVPRWRGRMLPLLAGSAMGFGFLCLPFVVGAPHAFVHEVLVDQLGRVSSVVNDWSIGSALTAITGLAGIPALSASTGLAIGLGRARPPRGPRIRVSPTGGAPRRYVRPRRGAGIDVWDGRGARVLPALRVLHCAVCRCTPGSRRDWRSRSGASNDCEWASPPAPEAGGEHDRAGVWRGTFCAARRREHVVRRQLPPNGRGVPVLEAGSSNPPLRSTA